MRVADFDFSLPEALIASYPEAQRSACRLLSLDGVSGELRHGVFTDVCGQLNAGDLLVFNDTRVIPARLYGWKASGGKVEMLVERLLDEQRVLAHVRASKAPKPGSRLWLGAASPDAAQDERPLVCARVLARHGALFEVRFDDKRTVTEMLEDIGHMPLPPYIKRPDEHTDRERYQTVYSQRPGAVAAPTAGLHFDKPLLDALRAKGVEMAFVTLHVGAGTFQPVRVADVQQHVMHAEYVEVSSHVAQAVLACKARGNKVVAVGTTSVRSLESAAQLALLQQGQLQRGQEQQGQLQRGQEQQGQVQQALSPQGLIQQRQSPQAEQVQQEQWKQEQVRQALSPQGLIQQRQSPQAEQVQQEQLQQGQVRQALSPQGQVQQRQSPQAEQVQQGQLQQGQVRQALSPQGLIQQRQSPQAEQVQQGQLQQGQPQLMVPFAGDTQIFIYPGYQFRIVDALITNFHLPQSTLLMLVSAFAGFQHVMHAYQQAVQERYHFFSYGDAMYITRNPHAAAQAPDAES